MSRRSRISDQDRLLRSQRRGVPNTRMWSESPTPPLVEWQGVEVEVEPKVGSFWVWLQPMYNPLIVNGGNARWTNACSSLLDIFLAAHCWPGYDVFEGRCTIYMTMTTQKSVRSFSRSIYPGGDAFSSVELFPASAYGNPTPSMLGDGPATLSYYVEWSTWAGVVVARTRTVTVDFFILGDIVRNRRSYPPTHPDGSGYTPPSGDVFWTGGTWPSNGYWLVDPPNVNPYNPINYWATSDNPFDGTQPDIVLPQFYSTVPTEAFTLWWWHNTSNVDLTTLAQEGGFLPYGGIPPVVTKGSNAWYTNVRWGFSFVTRMFGPNGPLIAYENHNERAFYWPVGGVQFTRNPGDYGLDYLGYGAGPDTVFASMLTIDNLLKYPHNQPDVPVWTPEPFVDAIPGLLL